LPSKKAENGTDPMPEATDDSNGIVKPRFTGRFSVYDTESGGIHIAWLPDDVDASETQHIDLPGPIVQIIKNVGEGKIKNPMDIVKAVAGANGMQVP
jgi:hypothetical protein